MWKKHEVDDSRRGKSSLLCGECKQATQQGRTKKCHGMHDCAGCFSWRGSLGRECFSGEDLKNQKKKKEKTNEPYTLVCFTCKEREARVLQALDVLTARPCTFCHSSTWRHRPECRAMKKTTVRISQKELEWLHFRPKYRSSPPVNEFKYYKNLGVLIP